MRRWTYRFVLRPGTRNTPGRRIAADMAGPDQRQRRFWTRRGAQYMTSELIGRLAWGELDRPVAERVFGHLDIEVVRVDEAARAGTDQLAGNATIA